MSPETPDGYPITELIRAIDARLHGPAELRITGVNNLEQAEPGDLTLAGQSPVAGPSSSFEGLGVHRSSIFSRLERRPIGLGAPAV